MTEIDRRLHAALVAATTARQAGRRDEEVRQLDAAVRLAPANPQALNARGMRALNDGDHEQARDLFAAAADADPGEPALWMNLATANRGLADDAGEAAALERVLAIDRVHFMATLRMAELDERRGRLAQAAQGWSGIVQMALGLPERPPRVA